MERLPPCIALVDDDEPVRKALRRLLRAANLEVEIYTSGREFIESLDQRRPNCLILDLHMPGMNGLDVQRWLVENRVPVPVVIITGYHDPQARLQCLAAGAIAYLRKPIDDKALLDAIDLATTIGPDEPA